MAKKRKGGRTAHQRKFGAAAKACGGKGKSRRAFQACVRDKLK